MASYWARKLENKASQNFTGRTQEIEFFDTLINVAEPEYLLVHLFGVGGVGKTTLLDKFETMAKNHRIIVGRVNEAQRAIPDILEKFHQDIRKQGGKLDNFAQIYYSFTQLQRELRHDPEFTVAMLENSGRVYSTQRSLPPKESPSPPRTDPAEREYNLSVVRELLTAAFDETEIIHFCYDTPDFRPVHEQIGQHMSKAEIINQLIEFSERQLLMEQLLTNVRRLNPRQYERYQPLLYQKKLPPDLAYSGVTEDGFQFLEYLHRRLADPQSRELLLNTNLVLTQAFIRDLGWLSQQQRLLLIFDTWEFLLSFADKWLGEEFLGQNLDQIGSNVTLATAGREPLTNQWQPYYGIVQQIELKPFSAREADEFLLTQGIADPATRQALQDLSGNLPLMLALLSTDTRAHIDELSATQNVIERFLKWIPQYESVKREAIITCAFPRFFDESVISSLLPNAEAKETFNWLCSFSFTTGHTGHWRYHSIVRRLMMQYRFDQSPEQCYKLHAHLASYYEMRMAELDLAEQEKRQYQNWRHLELEWLYHQLCQTRGFDIFIRLFLQAFRWSSYAQELVNTFMEAQEDLREKNSLYEWYELFQKVPQCRDALDCSLPDWTPLFERLAEYAGLTDSSLRAFVHYELGYFYTKQKRYLTAEQVYHQAIALQPEYVSAYNGLGLLYELTGRLAEAEQTYRRCLELEPKYIFPYHHLGRLLHRARRDDEAEAFYREAITVRPNLPLSYFYFGEFLQSLERNAEAESMYRQTLELDPGHVNAHINLGQILEKRGQGQQAEAMYQQAISIDPHHYLAHLRLGLLQASTNRFAEAIASFRRCLELDGTRPNAYVALARLLTSLGREGEALEVYRQVAKLAPDNPALKYVMAELCEKLGRDEEALKWFEAYLALAPDDVETSRRVAKLKAK
jgi:tetratricopeptide (TPR) repeat protein